MSRENEKSDGEEPNETQNQTIEFSESGTPILRHEAREREFQAGAVSPYMEAIEAHITRHIGPIDNVLHEIISDLVHLDVFHVAPTEDFPFHTYITCGMSALEMPVPLEVEEREKFRFAELLICLPENWQVVEKNAVVGGQETAEEETCYWPIRWLKTLARLPHDYNTWLWCGHTVPNGDPPQPFAPNTKLCCTMLAPPLSWGEEFITLRLEDGNELWFWTMQTLYEDEINYKLQHGGDAIFDLLEEHQVGDVLQIDRPSVVPQRKRWFGRF